MKLGYNEFKVCRFRYLNLKLWFYWENKWNVPKKWTISRNERNICYKWYLKVTKQFFDNILSITKANSLILSFSLLKKRGISDVCQALVEKKSVICSTFFFTILTYHFFFRNTSQFGSVSQVKIVKNGDFSSQWWRYCRFQK